MPIDLINRGAFTLGALMVCTIGTYIPLPGVDTGIWTMLFDARSGGLISQANALSGGALGRLSILSLSIAPYLTAAIIIQLLAMVSPGISRLRFAGERGRSRIELYTRGATLLLAALQGYGIANALEGAGAVVIAPGPLFRLTTMLTLVAGTVFLVWLASQITARGLGNGIALILALNVVKALPRDIATLIQASRQEIIVPRALPVVALLIAGLIALIVLAERSRRRLPVEFTTSQAGPQRPTADIVLKLNPAGLMPAVIVGMLLSILLALHSLAGVLGNVSGWFSPVEFALGEPVRLAATTILIVLLTFVYTAFLCDPDQMAARLAACGGALPGIAPGEATAAYLDRAISRSAAIGAVYLAVVIIVPELLTLYLALPVMLQGAPILLVVCVVLDLMAETQARLAHPG
jgi:preprotein translocase subunit SecY